MIEIEPDSEAWQYIVHAVNDPETFMLRLEHRPRGVDPSWVAVKVNGYMWTPPLSTIV